ncbi:MAG: OmpH family outer membrane protein [Bacteroidota bacterium]
MQKLFIVATITLALVFLHNEKASAQAPKFGYFDMDYMVSLLPGVSDVDSLRMAFENDTLGARYDSLLSELRKEDSLIKNQLCGMPTRVDTARQQKMANLFYAVQNWQQYAREQSEQRQGQLMQPFLDTVRHALQAVIEEQRYSYVFRKRTFWYAAQTDDLKFPVAKKLGLRLPPQLQGPIETVELFFNKDSDRGGIFDPHAWITRP